MGLSFTDDQIKTISQQVLQIPDEIAAQANALANAQAAKDTAESQDQDNKVFFDFEKGVIDAYHEELVALDGSQKTEYTETILDNSAAQRAGNLHYPTSPPWTKMNPKLIDQNQGLPVSPQADNETSRLAAVTAAIDEMKNGFSDGALDDTATDPVAGGQVEVDTGGFAIGQRIVIDDSGQSLLGEITAIDPPLSTGAELLSFNLIAGVASLGAGARVRNFHPGFTNAEREGTSVPYAPEVLAYFQSEIDSQTVGLDGFLDDELAALATNEAGGSEEAEIDQAETDIAAVQANIDTWQAAPATGAGVGRYGDTGLGPLETAVSDRNTQVPARTAQIATALGSVNQDAEGEFTGSGHYKSLFTWVVQRAGKAGGTLFTFYNSDLILVFINQKITNLNGKKDEFDNQMLVLKLAEDPDGSDVITLEDVTGLSISDTIKVLDNSATPVLTATIEAVGANTLDLDQNVSGFTVGEVARVVKVL